MGIRRVVTGHDENGKAIITFDGDAPRVKRPASTIESTLLWVTDAMPARLGGEEDGGDVEVGIGPPPNGAVFRIIEFKPENEDDDLSDLSYMTSAGAEQPDDARHPGMHKTKTIDFAVVLSGEIDMMVDDNEVHLKPGDTVVQRGTNHAWVNRGTVSCVLACVLIDAEAAT